MKSQLAWAWSVVLTSVCWVGRAQATDCTSADTVTVPQGKTDTTLVYQKGSTAKLKSAVDLTLLMPVKETCDLEQATFDQYEADKADFKTIKTGVEKALSLPGQEGCISYESMDKQTRVLIALVDSCAPVVAPAAAGPDIEIAKNGKFSTPSVQAGKKTSLSVENDSAAQVKVTCTGAAVLPAALVVPAGKQATLPIPSDLQKSGATLACNAAPAAGPLSITIDKLAEQPAADESQTAPAAATSKCDESQFVVPLEQIPSECGSVGANNVLTLCMSASAQWIGPQPEIHEGETVNIEVIADSGFGASVALDASFERTLVAHAITELPAFSPKSIKWGVIRSKSVFVSAQGTLHVSFHRGTGPEVTTDLGSDAGGTGAKATSCTIAELAVNDLSLTVHGRYYFSAGLMVAYTRLQSRSFSRQTGDDGVMRIGEQDSPGIDYVLNVVAYPAGVDEEKAPFSWGLLFGTSVGSLGKRWYGGLELASPIGFGVSAGAAVVVVPKLDEPLVSGQPFSGDQLATHDVAEPTWYVGVNLQATLFKTVFGALFPSTKQGSH
jgi:hypothetical protein